MTALGHSPNGSTRAAYDVLWSRFLDGTYSAGARLREASLAEELGMSRTPVREALGRLLAEGLVAPTARGVVVAGLDHKAGRDIFDLRRVLEGFAAELVAVRTREGLIPPIWFHDLEESILEFANAVGRGDATAATQSNMQIHGLIVQASDNEFLADAHRRAIARLAVSTALNLEDRSWAKTAVAQHEQILAAIRDGDAVVARKISESHIEGAIHAFDAI